MTAWTAHVTVATVIEKNGKFLFVEEHTEGVTHSVFNQPAGHVEAGESLIEAAVRETMEETGHLVKINALLGIYSYTPSPYRDWETDRKSTRLNSSHSAKSRMPSSA